MAFIQTLASWAWPLLNLFRASLVGRKGCERVRVSLENKTKYLQLVCPLHHLIHVGPSGMSRNREGQANVDLFNVQ